MKGSDMAGTIKVDPAQLQQTASQIDTAAGEYRKLYNQLYSDVSAMRSGWTGTDNQAFTDQIEGFKDDFEKMAQLMDEYSAFLKDAAQKYQTTQDEVAAGARRLTN